MFKRLVYSRSSPCHCGCEPAPKAVAGAGINKFADGGHLPFDPCFAAQGKTWFRFADVKQVSDPGLRDQWFKLVRQVGSLVSEQEQTVSRKKTLGKVRIDRQSL